MARGFVTTAVLVLVAGTAGWAWAQQGSGGASGSPDARVFDPSTVQTVKGEISRVEQLTPARGPGRMGGGIHLVVKTDKETIPVHLGPAWYVDKQGVKLAAGDKIEVRGSRVTLDGQPAIIASDVTKGSQVLHLRDSNGVPAWAGWRRGAP